MLAILLYVLGRYLAIGIDKTTDDSPADRLARLSPWVVAAMLTITPGCPSKPSETRGDSSTPEHTESGHPMDTAASPDSGVDARGPGDSASADSGTPDSGTPTDPLRVLMINTGNLDEVTGEGCPSEPYKGANCSRTQEDELAASIASVEPDIAILLEVFDVRSCTEEDLAGDADRICTGADVHEPYQTARRLLGDGYTISCDARSHRSCIGVRSDRLTMSACAEGQLCMESSMTAAHPEACADRGSLTSVSRVDLTWTLDAGVLEPGSSFSVIAAHPLNATDLDGDACRLAQYMDTFDNLPDAGPTLVGGDMNMDPYRVPDLFPSAVYWHTRVGDEQRFEPHSVDGDPPSPTWMDLLTLDYVLSDFLSGGCTVLDDDERIDVTHQLLDHRAVLCTLDSVEGEHVSVAGDGLFKARNDQHAVPPLATKTTVTGDDRP